VRQLRDWKFSVDIAALDRVLLTTYAGLCCWTLARAIRRSDRDRRLPRETDTFDEAIAAFAAAYTDQTERDHQALADAVKSGRVPVETGL
jgi:hypothetical protein